MLTGSPVKQLSWHLCGTETSATCVWLCPPSGRWPSQPPRDPSLLAPPLRRPHLTVKIPVIVQLNSAGWAPTSHSKHKLLLRDFRLSSLVPQVLTAPARTEQLPSLPAPLLVTPGIVQTFSPQPCPLPPLFWLGRKQVKSRELWELEACRCLP